MTDDGVDGGRRWCNDEKIQMFRNGESAFWALFSVTFFGH